MIADLAATPAAPAAVSTTSDPTGMWSPAPVATGAVRPTGRSADLPIATVQWRDPYGRALPCAPSNSPLAGVAVSLRAIMDGRDDEVASTSTDSTGSYAFVGLPAGDYAVILTVPSGENGDREAGDHALTPVHTWAGEPGGFRLTGTLR
jgi:hypothetical protein